jgi:hypothetical protein
LKKTTLLFLVLFVSVILAVFVRFSLSTGTMGTTTATQIHSSEVANPGSAFEESKGGTANIETYFNVSEGEDQITCEQPENASCPDVFGSTGSCGQVSDAPDNENVSIPTPFPDGRIFTRGEPPYGYLPTCGPKDSVPPFVPIEPD